MEPRHAWQGFPNLILVRPRIECDSKERDFDETNVCTIREDTIAIHSDRNTWKSMEQDTVIKLVDTLSESLSKNKTLHSFHSTSVVEDTDRFSWHTVLDGWVPPPTLTELVVMRCGWNDLQPRALSPLYDMVSRSQGMD